MSDPNNRHPDSDFEAEYPYNQSTITRSGHEIHINDTPGHESLKVSHTKGTYAEINQDGRLVFTVQQKGYFYYKDGLTETIDASRDTKISQNYLLNIDNSTTETVGYDKNIHVGQNLQLDVGGWTSSYCKSDKNERIDGDSTYSVGGDSHNSIEGEQVNYVEGHKQDILNSDWGVTTQGNIEIVNQDGIFRVKCKTFMIEADQIVLQSIAGPITLTASDIIKLTGSEIHLND